MQLSRTPAFLEVLMTVLNVRVIQVITVTEKHARLALSTALAQMLRWFVLVLEAQPWTSYVSAMRDTMEMEIVASDVAI